MIGVLLNFIYSHALSVALRLPLLIWRQRSVPTANLPPHNVWSFPVRHSSFEHRTNAVMETQQQLQIKLIPARTAEERSRNIIANIVVEGKQAALVPYIDDHEHVSATVLTQLDAIKPAAAPSAKKRLRYYAVGPSTYKLICPLCEEPGNAAVMRAAGLKDASCCLSMLSCFFPIFWLCCICTWCGCNREWTTKGIYCSRCGGKLGMQRRPK